MDGFELLKCKEGHYSIVEGHNEIFRFPDAPIYANPVPEGISYEEEDELLKDPIFCEKDNIYMNACEKLRKVFIFPPQMGHEIVEACKKSGWIEEHGWIEYWIMNKAAKMIQGKENENLGLK